MHVVLASHRYFPVPGGSERVVQTIAEELVRRGHRATVVTSMEPGSPSRETLHGVDLIRLTLRHAPGFRIPSGYLRTLRSLDADVFHLHGNRIWCADFYFPFARSFRWPQVLTGHGFYQYEMRRAPLDVWYFERYFPWAVRAFDAYTADTESERRQVIRFGADRAKVEPVPLGIDLSEFSGPVGDRAGARARWGVTKPRLAVYAGGFFENKRVDRLVEAVVRVRDRWSLLAIGRDLPGSPVDLAACKRLAARAGVEFLAPGELSRSETLAALGASDAVVLGSEYEGFGLFPVEGMASARPFVAFRVGAVPELARAGGGIVVDTIDEFGQALRALDDDGTLARAGDRARAAAAQFSADAMVDRYLSIYQRIQSSEPATAGVRDDPSPREDGPGRG